MSKTCGVYVICNLINDHFYVGSSVDCEQRINSHVSRLNRGRHINPHLQNAWNKYGGNDFECLILETCDRSQMREIEQWYLDNTEPEYNIRKKAAGRYEGHNKKPFNEEHRRRLSIAQKGKALTEETRRKISESKTGTRLTIEHRHKISESLMGKRHTEEARRRMSVARSGQTMKPQSEEHRRKISEGLKRAWKRKNATGNFD